MRHAGFREVVILASQGVPWSMAASWSDARRAAAVRILEEVAASRVVFGSDIRF